MNPPITRTQLGNTRAMVSQLGLGGAAFGNLYSPITDQAAFDTMQTALSLGINHIDTAPFYGYGLSEQRIGHMLSMLNNPTNPPITLSSKVGRRLLARNRPPREDHGFIDALPYDPVFDYTYDGVMRSFQTSCERLGVEHISIVLFHDLGRMTHGKEKAPEYFRQAMQDGYRALHELRNEGRIDAIGLGVNETEVCMSAMQHAEFDCFLLAGRYTLLEQDALRNLLPLCATKGVSLIIGGPFNSGVLAELPNTPTHYDYAPANKTITDKVAALRQICHEYNVPLGAAALRFPLLHPAVVSGLPGARSAQEVTLNAQWLNLTIPKQLWHDLKDQNLIHIDAPIDD
ncbi:MAG: aldo/keto reductase [Gammaproteobacteria bacterium]|nr:aldo/keto reductase [Gammaproteobacteria bacterium]